ncbi:ECF transporter S component [Paeniglutamicibacter kerguelensis]|uniref:Energy-coupling factor transport system substrate-specific component n=1 Tax=Paeniglutamicibacter kerguelensis TaxID=254788 RepID=A0ABS4XIC6_9MICC|nr:ECF transporter S component [Paeniglutamicibacter kerguelensis]MBP2388230.1 energy-coupling factor transport system substrate-specific component [Paeniglutamicibacter kerguelensis]
MSEQIQDSALRVESYDAIARDLQRLRFEAGDIPYAEIVRRIAEHREQNGVPASASRPARTTVYDAFRLGRSRVNPTLVGEIARALDVSEEDAVLWEARCLQARRQLDSEPSTETRVSDVERIETKQEPKRATLRASLILMVACVGINVAGFSIVPWLSLPLYLDMVGTAIAALVLGPWYGVAVGLMTNAIGLSITDSSSIWFGLVNIVGALIWGYGARRFRLCQSFSRYVLLNAVVAVACTLVATTLLVLLFNGATGHAAELTTDALVDMGEPLTLAVFISNLVHSLTDKGLTALASLGAMGFVSRWFEVPFYVSLVETQPSGLLKLANRFDVRKALASRAKSRA